MVINNVSVGDNRLFEVNVSDQECTVTVIRFVDELIQLCDGPFTYRPIECIYAQNPLHTFPRRRGSCWLVGSVADFMARQQVRSNSLY